MKEVLFKDMLEDGVLYKKELRPCKVILGGQGCRDEVIPLEDWQTYLNYFDIQEKYGNMHQFSKEWASFEIQERFVLYTELQ